MFCPECAKLGKKTKTSAVIAVPEEQIRQLNPIMPNINDFLNILNKNVIVDRGFCEMGHGLVAIAKPELSMV